MKLLRLPELIHMNRADKRRQRKSGMALIVMLTMVGVLVVLTGVVGAEAMVTMNFETKTFSNDQAHYGAYSAIQNMLSELELCPNTGIAPTAGPATGYSPGTSGVNNNGAFMVQFTDNSNLTAIVCCYNNMATAAYPASYSPNGVLIPSGCVYITATAQIGSQTAAGSSAVSTFAAPHKVCFPAPILGTQVVNLLNNSTVDCYNTSQSPIGSYAAYTIPSATWNSYASGQGASVYTNNNTQYSMNIASNSSVDGNVYTGSNNAFNAWNETVVAPATTDTNISGQNLTEPGLQVLPTRLRAPHPPVNYVNAQYGNLLINTNQSFPAGGYYYINGNLEVTTGGVLSINTATLATNNTGTQTFFYVTGNVYVHDGGVINPGTSANPNGGGYPENCNIFVSSNGGQLVDVTNSKMPGNNFVLSGAGENVTLTNATLFGAVQGAQVTLTNSSIHFDVGLPSIQLGPGGWDVGAFVSGSTGLKGATSGTSGGTTTGGSVGTTGTSGVGTSGTGGGCGGGGGGCGCGCGCGGGSD